MWQSTLFSKCQSQVNKICPFAFFEVVILVWIPFTVEYCNWPDGSCSRETDIKFLKEPLDGVQSVEVQTIKIKKIRHINVSFCVTTNGRGQL